MSEFKHMLAQEIHGFEEVEKLLSTHCVEEKFDGARIIVFFDEKGEYKIINREGRDITEQFPEFSYFKGGLKDCALDGELICFKRAEDGTMVADFQAIQKRITLQKKEDIELRKTVYPAAIAFFDIVIAKGGAISNAEYLFRKPLLDMTVKFLSDATNATNIGTAKPLGFKTLPEFMKYWNDIIVAEKREGVMFKDLHGIYEEGKRSWAWKKFKYKKSLDLPIIRFEETVGEKGNAGMVCYSTYKGNEIRVAVNGIINRKKVKNGAHMLEVEYLAETNSGKLRQPVCKCVKENG